MNYLNYILIAAAIAQAIAIENAPGTPKDGRRARAIKTVLTAITPLIPSVASHPEVAEHIGQLIDDFVALQKKVPAVAAPIVPQSQP